MRQKFQMLHLIDELRRLLAQVQNFVCDALSVHFFIEVGDCAGSQVVTDGVHWEVEAHDVAVFKDFHIACVFFEEHVRVSLCKL